VQSFLVVLSGGVVVVVDDELDEMKSVVSTKEDVVSPVEAVAGMTNGVNDAVVVVDDDDEPCRFLPMTDSVSTPNQMRARAVQGKGNYQRTWRGQEQSRRRRVQRLAGGCSPQHMSDQPR
jgi:hypothetical protein